MRGQKDNDKGAEARKQEERQTPRQEPDQEPASSGEPTGVPIARRSLLGLLGGAVLGGAALSAGGLLLGESEAYALPNGTIGLTFDSVTEVLAGETVTGRVYTYDLGGADALQVSIDYDNTVFTGLTLEAPAGVTILADNNEDDRVSAVLMIDPTVANYSNLLIVTAQAGGEGGAGRIALSYAKAAVRGTEYEQVGIGADDNTIAVREAVLDPDTITLATLSLAMTFYQVTEGSAKWPSAAKYDLVADGVIDIKDFIRIANILLDLQNNIKLKFREDGSFKILSVSDYHGNINRAGQGGTVDQRSVALLNALLDAEQPDLVIFNGDLHDGNMNGAELQECYRQIVEPAEQHKTPWLVTFGNHDEDAGTAVAEGWGKRRQLEYFRSFPYNVNRMTMSGLTRAMTDREAGTAMAVGDMYTFVYDSEGKDPLYNIWAIDSNIYQNHQVSRPIPYQSYFGSGTWHWIQPEQSIWYYQTSQQIEAKYGKLSALMFFHIPLQEFSNMYADKERHGVTGTRGETECPGYNNSGMFTFVYERGDVKGIFCGHEHDNDYIGKYCGTTLCYDGSIGFEAYGAHELKGGRITELNTSDLSTFTTRMVCAPALGL